MARLHAFAAVVTLACLAGCAGRPKPPASAASAPRRADPTAPTDLSPNVRHDRREEPGVRARAKPLALAGSGARDLQCGKLGRAFHEQKASQASRDMLGGRLKITTPSSAKQVSSPPGSPSTDEEERLVFEAGGAGLAIVAREMFQLDPDLYQPGGDAPIKPGTLDTEAPKFLRHTFHGPSKLDVEPVALEAGGKIRAYAARPRQPNAPPGEDTALVLAMLVALPDGTLQSVAFYVRGELVRSATGSALVGCTRMAERMASTLAIGQRSLERDAGMRRIALLSSKEELAVRVPEDYVVVRGPTAPVGTANANASAGSGAPDGSAGGGGDAVRLYKLKPLSLYPGNIAISLSDAKDESVVKDADAHVDGRLLGRDVRWRGKTSPKGGYLFAAEPLQPTADGDGKPAPAARFASVLLKATRQAQVLDEFRGVAETLAIVRSQ